MRKLHYFIVGGAVLVLGLAYLAWATVSSASVGAAAMAKVTCSCVFIDGRSLEDCRADDPPGFESIQVVVDQSEKTATGSVFALIKSRAKFNEQFGCTLEP